MDTSARARLVTADELLWMREDRCRYELVRGELRKYPFRGHVEGAILAHLGALLGLHVRENALGTAYAPTGFHIASDPDTVLAPPLSFVREGRWDDDRDRDGYGPGAPDLAVEIVSPAVPLADLEAKARDWLAAGCRMVIVVDPDRRAVAVYRPPDDDVLHLGEDDVLDAGDVVPGWRVPVREIFD